jgi:hypothetical protein
MIMHGMKNIKFGKYYFQAELKILPLLATANFAK